MLCKPSEGNFVHDKNIIGDTSILFIEWLIYWFIYSFIYLFVNLFFCLSINGSHQLFVFVNLFICCPHLLLFFFLYLLFISSQPKVVTDTEEQELARHLENLEKANAEVDGDDDNEEIGNDED